jgi:hypothetical protein
MSGSKLQLDDLYQVWLKLACNSAEQDQKKKKKLSVLSLFISSLGEGCFPSFEQTWIFSSKDDLCLIWLKIKFHAFKCNAFI